MNKLPRLLHRLRPVAPLTLVTGFAMYGQGVYWLQHPTRPDAPVYERVGLAVGAAVAMEVIALYVQWHAHDALLNKATATAARLRRASYVIAVGIASLNYSQFSDHWYPTPAAVAFALFSTAGPWLWGLHTRRVQHLQLLREGQADTSGAVFSAERFRNFPVLTWRARRYSIDHGITDPRIAWEAYRLEMQCRSDDLPAAWQQLALSLLRLEDAQDHAEWAANMVSPIDVPELERHEDIVVPDLDLVDGNGLSKRWHTAPSAPAAPRPKPRPRSAGRAIDAVDHDKARQLIQEEGLGEVLLQRELGCKKHVATALIKLYRPVNGSKVPTS